MFVIVGSLVVLLLTAALVGPYFIDWTNYRAEFEAEASKILGRQVTVEGEPSVRLLPFPSVTFSDVHVAGTQPGSTAMTAETFSMDAELAPLMSGEFRIFDMRLVRPRMRIAVDEQGAIDWAVRPSTPFDPRQISVEALTITDGAIDLVHGPSGKTHQLSGLNATLSARSLAGPWRMNGTMQLDGMASTLEVSTGAVSEDGGMRLHVSGGPDAYPIAINMDGTLRFTDEQPDYSGTLRLTASNAMPPKPVDGQEPPRPTPPDYRVASDFSLSSERLALDEARFETGPLENPYTAEGTAEITFGEEARFAIRADGAQVRFDETVAGAEGPGVTLEQRINALEGVLSALPRPTIPGVVEVNLPAVVAGGSTIRDVRLSAQPAQGGWELETFAASLPGRTRLEGSGLLRTGSDFGFSGRLLLAVAQPSGFAAWLSKDVDEAIRVLPAAGFDATVEMSRTRQDLQDLELQLGDARFHGQVTRLQPGDARPSMRVALDGDALDVEGLAAFASLFVSDQGETRLADHDLDFDIKAGPVRAAGLVAETLDTALRLRGERLEIDRLSIGGLAGASISATGTVERLGTAPTGDLDASVISTDLAPLIARLSERYRDVAFLAALNERATAYPGLFADARLDLIASAADAPDKARGLALSAQGVAGGTTLQISASSGDLSLPLDAQPLNISLDTANDDATALLALGGFPALPLGMLERAESNLTLKGTLRDGLETSFALHGSDIDAAFDGTVSSGNEGLAAQGKARLTTSDIEPWLMTTGVGLPGMGLGSATVVEGDLALQQGVLTSKLSGSWNDDPVEGEVSAQMRDGRPHLGGTLSLGYVDLADGAGMVLGADAMRSDGGNWSQTPFAGAPSLPFTFDLELTARELAAGYDLALSDASLGLKVDENGLRITDLRGGYAGGQLSGMASLENSAGTGLLSAQLVLANADLSRFSGQAALQGKGDFGVSASSSGKSVEGLVSALSGSGSARLRDLVIDHLNPNALPELISAADTIGRTVDSVAVAAFAPGVLTKGRYEAGNADVAFTLVSGVLRVPTMQFASATSRLASELAIDLTDQSLSGQATVTYDPGEDGVAGSQPGVTLEFSGPVSQPDVSYETTALAQFLTQRALEIEQARVEAMQAQLLEQQRLRRETRYYTALRDQRLEEARRKAEEEARQAAEAAAAVMEAARQEEERAARAEAERQQAAERAAQALREAAERARQQPAPTPPATPPTNFQMPLDIPPTQELRPLSPAPQPDGMLPGVFDIQPGG